MHGTVYAREYGFDSTFEAYVAGPLAEFALRRSDRDRLWLADGGGRVVGCVAIVEAPDGDAQLRWFVVAPEVRGLGLGRRLLAEAIEFARREKYRSVFLWTVSALTAAARLYRAAGFELAEQRPGARWGVGVVEERYLLQLSN